MWSKEALGRVAMLLTAYQRHPGNCTSILYPFSSNLFAMNPTQESNIRSSGSDERVILYAVKQ
jgi:hypothetical protein